MSKLNKLQVIVSAAAIGFLLIGSTALAKTIKLENGGGYDVTFYIEWSRTVEPYKKNTKVFQAITFGTWDTGKFSLGKTKTFDDPKISAEYNGKIPSVKAIAWNPFGKDKTVFTKTYSNLNDVPGCFKVYGTIFKPNWKTC